LLEQLLSLITPITSVKRIRQAEQCNQMEAVLALYMARMNTLEPNQPMKHYLSTRDEPKWIQPNFFTQITIDVQRRLREGMDSRFFSRYSDLAELRTCPYVFEMLMRLSPTYKRPKASLNRIIRLCCRSRGGSMVDAQQRVQAVNARIVEKLREKMMSIVSPLFDVAAAPDVKTTPFSDELAEFAVRAPQQPPANLLRDRVDEELRRWMDTAGFRRTDDRQRESVLQFWSRMSGSGEYRILPKVARIVFVVPGSSAHIERDFGVSGMVATTQRIEVVFFFRKRVVEDKYCGPFIKTIMTRCASLTDHTIDMSSFLNRNRGHLSTLSSAPRYRRMKFTSKFLPTPSFRWMRLYWMMEPTE
jgi:hypothetical protein